MIQFIDVKKVYNNKNLALNNICLNIDDGEFVFIVGASGSGKSTILKLISKEENVSDGKIFVNNLDITSLSKRKIPYLRRTMGIVFQDFRLIDKLNAFDNVAFAMHVIGASKQEIKKRVSYVLGLVGLENKANRKPFELSGGEQQRVGIARALVNNPQLIIADEPTGNIDPSMSEEIVSLFEEINKTGTTIIMVTHDLSIIKKFPFRVIEVSKGTVLSDTKIRGENV